MKLISATFISVVTVTLMGCASPAKQQELATLFIGGAVELPGRYENIKPNEQNLYSLILKAGGLSFPSSGSRGAITLYHKGDYKNGEKMDLDPVRLMKEGKGSEINIKLSDGDFLDIRRQYD